MQARTGWQELIAEVPRDLFIPDTIWVDIDASHPQSGFVALSKQDDPQRWAELIGADEPVITQVDEGLTAVGDTGWSPSSSCSKPSIVAGMLDALDVRPGHSVLEIGAGTGWNAALLGWRVGQRGRVVSIGVAADHSVTGSFGGDLAFMRLRSQRRRFYEPAAADIAHADVTTTEVHGWDFFRMINSAEAAFAIGLRVPRCALTVELNKFGKDHNVLELDDITTTSWARLDVNLTAPDKLVVRQLGPRRLWDEAEAAYDWWYEHGKPSLARFGMTMTADTQTVWIDEPNTIVRNKPSGGVGWLAAGAAGQAGVKI